MFERLFASRKRPYVPGLNAFETLEVNLSGNKFSITLPPHSGDPELHPKFSGNNIDIYQRDQYEDLSHLPDYDKGRFPYFCFLERNMGFYGAPWLARSHGDISFYAFLRRVDKLPDTMSCFNPGHFEQVIAHDLYYRFGPAHVGFEKKSAPHNWQIRPQGNSSWLYCETRKILDDPEYTCSDDDKADFDILLYTPIDDQYFLQLSFYMKGYSPSSASIKAMRTVIEKILPSLSIELNANTLRQQSQVLATAKQKIFCQTKSLEPWVHHQWRRGDMDLDEDRIVITKMGSPLPQLIPE